MTIGQNQVGQWVFEEVTPWTPTTTVNGSKAEIDAKIKSKQKMLAVSDLKFSQAFLRHSIF